MLGTEQWVGVPGQVPCVADVVGAWPACVMLVTVTGCRRQYSRRVWDVTCGRASVTCVECRVGTDKQCAAPRGTGAEPPGRDAAVGGGVGV